MSNDSLRQPPPPAAARTHVCPWWIGRLLLNPLRRLLESPERRLGPHVRPGMTVLEPGCGMGFFTLPLARMVGEHGRVVCVDLQPRMLAGLRRRAERAGLAARIETLAGTLDDPRLDDRRGAIDFAAAIHVVHEVPDAPAFLRRLHELLRPGARLLLIEPKGHVSAQAFADTVEAARAAGLVEVGRPLGEKSRSALLERSAEGAP